ncbi:MAG: hypothetical protein LBP50_11340, partial [Tannerella sp.]|nr:hypothetical protein [Tannerella sp.]
IDVAKEIENAKKKVADFKQEIEDLRSGKTQVEAGQNLTETINNKLNALKEAEDKLAVLTGKQGKPPKPPKSNEQEYLEAEQKLANEQVELRLKTGKRILDAMDESFAKRKLKIESEYRKEEQEVKEEGEKLLRLLQKQETEKWIKGGSKGTAPVVESLPPEMQADVDAGYEAVREKRRAEEERLRLDMEQMAEEERLRFADALLKQLSDIEGYYRERIRQAEGNETLIATLIQSKERELGAARSEYAREMLANEQEIVKSRIAASTGYYRLDADRREAELTAEKENTEERIRLMEEQYRNAPTEELGKDIELARIELDKFNRELSKMPAEKASELSGYFSKIAGALGGLDGEMGEVFSEMSNAFGSISEVMKSDMSSMEGKMGAYAAAIEGAVQLINLAVSAAKRRDAVEKEFYKNQIALAHEYALAINEQIRTQSEISGSGFIKDYAGEIKDGFDALTDATGKYQEALSKLADGKAKVDLRNAVDWGQVGKGAATGAAAGAAIGSVIPAIGTAVGAVVGGLVGGIVGLFGGKKKEAVNDSLLAVFPELVDAAGNLNRELAQTLISTDQVDENTKQLLQNAIDWADAVEEANGKINDLTVELAGDLGGNIKNALMEAFKAGEDASKRMFKAAGDSLGKFVEDILYSTVFSEVFKQFGEELAASLNPATGDQDVLDDYDRLMDNLDKRDELYLSLLETIKKRAQDRGFDLWEDDSGSSNENTLKGASAKASQESIDLMSGQMGAVRRTLELILASLNRVMTIRQDLIDSVMGGLNAVPELIASGLHELIAIRELNARIAASNDAIASNTHSIGEIAGRVAVIGVTVAGNRESLQLLRGDTAAIGAIAEDTKAAANSLHNMERSVNVNLSGL